jgi:hypothetical protein
MALLAQISSHIQLFNSSLHKQHYAAVEMKQAGAACPVRLAFLVLLVLLINFLANRLVFHPLSKIPGPKIAAITHLYQVYHFTIRQDWADTLRRLHEEYGKYGSSLRLKISMPNGEQRPN